MNFELCYGEAQVEVRCRVPVGTNLQGLLESRTVRGTTMFLQKLLGVEGADWDHKFVPAVADSNKTMAKSWCNLRGSSIVFFPAGGSKSSIPEQAALYRALSAEDRARTLRAASEGQTLTPARIWKDVRDALGEAHEQEKVQVQQQEELGFWVVYAEGFQDVLVEKSDAGAAVHMHRVYQMPEAVAATQTLLGQLQMDEGHACELKMRFIPELKAYDGGPSAAQWARFKGATVMFCEDPEVENEMPEGSLYKQAALYNTFLQLST